MIIKSLLWILVHVSLNSYVCCNHGNSTSASPDQLSLITKLRSELENSTLKFLKDAFKPTFVDKTQLIEDLLHPDTPRAIYLSTPRRFGKTCNQDMIAEMLHFPVRKDELSYTKDKKTTIRYILVNVHNDLTVTKNRSFFDENFANYLVLQIDLTADGDSFDELKEKINYRVYKNVFADYTRWWHKKGKQFVCRQNHSIRSHCEALTQIFEAVKWQRINMSADGLSLVIHYLKKFFDKRVILLIDHFDLSFRNALKYVNAECADSVLTYLTQMFDPLFAPARSTWSDDTNDTMLVHRGLFVGVADLPIGPGKNYLNSLRTYKFLDRHPFHNHYGFQQHEVDQLLRKNNLHNYTKQVAGYYRGYLVRNTTISIYNPLSISAFLRNKRLDCYWRRTGLISYWRKICHHEQIFNAVVNLADNRAIRVDPVDEMDLRVMKSLFDFKHGLRTNSSGLVPNYFYRDLLQEGYLTPAFDSPNLYKSVNFETLEEYRNALEICALLRRQ